MRLIVAGTRTFNDYDLLKSTLDHLLSNTTGEIIIVSGGAKGADLLGERYGQEEGYTVKRYKANWDRHGKMAGPIRNEDMAQNADSLVAFWDATSPGTLNMIQVARRHGLKIRVVIIPS